MGYVVDAELSQFTSPFECGYSAGTWTPTLASNVWTNVRTAADASFSVAIPVKLLGHQRGYRGGKLTSIDVWYSIATAAADDFATVSLEKMALTATGSAVTGAAVTTTIDTGHDTAAERKATGNHKMTVTLTTAEWVDEDEAFVLTLTVDAAATTVFALAGARANFELVL
jgi:hypothetical protein